MRRLFTAITLMLATAVSGSASAADCDQISVGLTPISEAGGELYLGLYRGGLYPDGLNTPPAAHAARGLARAAAIRRLSPAGLPAPGGKYVLLSIGMSNTTQEFCGAATCRPWTFGGQAAVDTAVNHTWLEIVDGAAGGQTTATWDSPTDANYDRVRDTRLAPRGLSEAQVQAVWIKLANAGPTVSLPSPGADAFALVSGLANVVRSVRVRYPNVQQVFLSSRIYAGYASTSLNPEPFAFESGFGVKWLIEAQIRQMDGGGVDPLAGDLDSSGVAPWIAWGPYLWADGTTLREDGLAWDCADFEADGTHPAQSGEQKVGAQLLSFFSDSPFTKPWFAREDPPLAGDLDGDEDVDLTDLSMLLANYGCSGGGCAGDIDGDGDTDLTDLSQLLANFGR